MITQQGAYLKTDQDTNLNNPRSEVDHSDCNLGLVWSSMEQKNYRIFHRKVWFKTGIKEHNLQNGKLQGSVDQLHFGKMKSDV